MHQAPHSWGFLFVGCWVDLDWTPIVLKYLSKSIDNKSLENIVLDLATFLKELQGITDVEGPVPGKHNWWRGDHVSVYDKGAKEQFANLADNIDIDRVL